MPDRFVCIHGHFYQPPRENPETGEIERQPSAGEDHDWNCRVARQCYIPNGRARIAGPDNETLKLVNNYARISFNFGPTLLQWYEKKHPDEYRRLLEADAESRRRCGHGNALGQAYNHMILPLANARDRATQLRWGQADFRRRFGREPEALWLPETACDDATLQALIDEDLKFAILSPAQARLVRPLGAPRWREVESGGLDTRRAYRWLDPRGRGRGIDLFFYHGPLSQAVAFGRLMADSKACAQRVLAACGEEGGLVSICTDGETYGHHETFAEMGLAHLLEHELPERGVELVNFASYLERHPPAFEVQLQRGRQGRGTAWSCAHGLGRWLEDCGCGAEGKQQRWRAPLREALDWLRDAVAQPFERSGGAALRDPWAARDAYIDLLLDPGVEQRFIAEHLKPGRAGDWALVRSLLEMQKYAMFMYTSCGWFFSDIAGLEAVQNLKYAARALELARQAGGRDLEPEFLRRLAAAPCNDTQFKDGATVYRLLVGGISAGGLRRS